MEAELMEEVTGVDGIGDREVEAVDGGGEVEMLERWRRRRGGGRAVERWRWQRRWRGGEVERWRGGEVERWSGGGCGRAVEWWRGGGGGGGEVDAAAARVRKSGGWGRFGWGSIMDT
jgi:hypothetical protein